MNKDEDLHFIKDAADKHEIKLTSDAILQRYYAQKSEENVVTPLKKRKKPLIIFSSCSAVICASIIVGVSVYLTQNSTYVPSVVPSNQNAVVAFQLLTGMNAYESSDTSVTGAKSVAALASISTSKSYDSDVTNFTTAVDLYDKYSESLIKSIYSNEDGYEMKCYEGTFTSSLDPTITYPYMMEVTTVDNDTFVIYYDEPIEYISDLYHPFDPEKDSQWDGGDDDDDDSDDSSSHNPPPPPRVYSKGGDDGHDHMTGPGGGDVTLGTITGEMVTETSTYPVTIVQGQDQNKENVLTEIEVDLGEDSSYCISQFIRNNETYYSYQYELDGELVYDIEINMHTGRNENEFFVLADIEVGEGDYEYHVFSANENNTKLNIEYEGDDFDFDRNQMTLEYLDAYKLYSSSRLNKTISKNY